MKSDIENREWLNEYPSLQQITQNNPFTVPEGYFYGLEGRIMSYTNINELTPSSASSFTVLENYFEELNDNIFARIAIEEVIDLDRHGFTVPEGYFTNMASEVKSQITVADSLNQPFTVPENYFEDLQTQITSRIAIDEAKTEPFAVPENYFSDLSRNILNQTAGLEAIKRKGLVRKLVSSAAFKYASAACFAFIVGAGIFITQINSPQATHNRSYLHKALSNVPDNDIKGYLQLRVNANDPKSTVIDKNDLNSVTVDDFKDYLNNN